MDYSILIVDDERIFLHSMVKILEKQGFGEVTTCNDPIESTQVLKKKTFDFAFLDINMPGMSGLELLEYIKERTPETECIMITANDRVESVVQAIKLGAYDYIVKPFTPDQIAHTLNRAMERKRLLYSLKRMGSSGFRKSFAKPDAFRNIITENSQMLRILQEAELHADSMIPVLITGETGVGKELLAKAVHQASNRNDEPFVAVNMLAITPSLFESEFFGHVKGSFTGADRNKEGYLKKANGGTLFLDEIGDLPMEIQGKLLRILQEGEFAPVGRSEAEAANVRFIAATNLDLKKKVEKGEFRKDLFYRLQFAHLHLPPLRERNDDIPMLSKRMLEQIPEKQNTTITPEAIVALMFYEFPGNVRELKGILEAAANLSQGEPILPRHLGIKLKKKPGRFNPSLEQANGHPEAVETLTLAEVEKRHILKVYRQSGRNKTQAAGMLDIGIQTLRRKLKSYGVK